MDWTGLDSGLSWIGMKLIPSWVDLDSLVSYWVGLAWVKPSWIGIEVNIVLGSARLCCNGKGMLKSAGFSFVPFDPFGLDGAGFDCVRLDGYIELR